jgi:hypothetical protein
MSDQVEKTTKDVLSKLSEIDEVMTGINRDLIDVKGELDEEQKVYLTKALSSLSNSQSSIQSVVESIQKVIDPPEQKKANDQQAKAKTEQTNELYAVAPILVEYGYSRDMSAPSEQFWYAHREGHQIRTSPSGNGMQWTYFPPKLLGETERGLGLEGLQGHLAYVHRRDDAQQTDEAMGEVKLSGDARSQEAQDAFDTPFKDFLIIQTQTDPIERFEVREAGHEYPRYVARFPKTGEWKDYTAEAVGSGAPPPRGTPSKYIDIVRYWVNRGKPVMKPGGEPSDARASGASPTPSRAVNAIGMAAMAGEGGYERSPSGSGSSPVAGMPDRR